MKQLKNCPNCGGILDDEGRCMYCKSKVYDLTGMRIDMDTRDTVLLKIKYGGYDVIMKAYPVHLEANMSTDYSDVSDWGGTTIARIAGPSRMSLNMEFEAVPVIDENGNETLYKACIRQEEN